ncbi:unnamed protein product [Blepharisma stoltei]|uniref:F-box domain-containing protein n=1 Tax=Blepharisma stoltei TaxID=1481888 RepID=A0AAU9K3E0_9CILI|nr:unnamed protein product [Blepharisma stoltei]
MEANVNIYNDTQDLLAPQSIDEGIALIQNPSSLRGLIELEKIFGNLFTRQEIKEAWKLNCYDIEKSALYLQDLAPENMPEIHQTTSEIKEKISREIELNDIVEPNNDTLIENVVEGPTRGKIALEFSLSPQYINTTVVIFYISDEILKEIFSFLSPCDRGKCATVCRTWKHIDLSTNYLYKIDCQRVWNKEQSRPDENVFPQPFNQTSVLWGANFPEEYKEPEEYLKSFKNWRNMWIKRPRIKFNGVYASKTIYYKQGEANIMNIPTYQKVVFYRYFRFYDDFSICCLTTAKKPRDIAHNVSKIYEGVRVGEWAKKKSQIVMHLLAKHEVYTYNFKICSTFSGAHDTLRLEAISSRAPNDLSFSIMNLSSDAWPKYFVFYPFK